MGSNREELYHLDATFFGVPTGMGSSIPAWKGNHQIRFAFAQHPLVPDEGRVAAFVRPVSWILNEINTTRAGPGPRNAVDTPRGTFNDGHEMILRVEPIKL